MLLHSVLAVTAQCNWPNCWHIRQKSVTIVQPARDKKHVLNFLLLLGRAIVWPWRYFLNHNATFKIKARSMITLRGFTHSVVFSANHFGWSAFAQLTTNSWLSCKKFWVINRLMSKMQPVKFWQAHRDMWVSSAQLWLLCYCCVV